MNVYYYPNDKVRMLFAKENEIYMNSYSGELFIKRSSAWHKMDVTLLDFLNDMSTFRKWFEEVKEHHLIDFYEQINQFINEAVDEDPDFEEVKISNGFYEDMALLHAVADVKKFFKTNNEKQNFASVLWDFAKYKKLNGMWK